MGLDPTKDLFEKAELVKIWGFLDEKAESEAEPGGKWTMFRALVGVLSRVGCRITEACMMTVGDAEVYREPAFLRVHRLKKKKTTIDLVEIDGELAGWIRAWLQCRPKAREAPLFVKPVSGKPWNRIEFQQAWRRLLREIGVEYRRPHALRHTHLTDYQSVCGDLAMTMKRAGHTSARTTMKYVDPRLEDRVKQIESLREMYREVERSPGLGEDTPDNIVDFPGAREGAA